MRVVFRTDSGTNIGSGHLTRCLTLANELRSRGAKVTFISREHQGNFIAKLEEASYSVHRLPCVNKPQINFSDDYSAWIGDSLEQDARETLLVLKETYYDWLVVDHYGLDVYWEQLIRPVFNQILVIDDLANRRHECDLLLDQNYFSSVAGNRYVNWVPSYCKCLFGPSYALLHPEYAQLRNIRQSHEGVVNRVLIFFGGSDPGNQTGKVLAAFDCNELSHIGVDVVIGNNHPDPEGVAVQVAEKPGVILHKNLPSLVGLMMRADFMIGAGGGTTWERMCLGIPSLVISLAQNQEESTLFLTHNDFQSSLSEGKQASSTDWRRVICSLLSRPDFLMRHSANARELVDGFGVKRVVQIMQGKK